MCSILFNSKEILVHVVVLDEENGSRRKRFLRIEEMNEWYYIIMVCSIVSYREDCSRVLGRLLENLIR
jgi:hypothetical protein